MKDLIREDEEKAVLDALDHAFDAQHPVITGERDMVHADELAACDKAWLSQHEPKPWEKPGADTQRSNHDQEQTR